MTSGQSKPWGYVLHYSVYLEGDPLPGSVIAEAGEAIEEGFAVRGVQPDFIGASVDVVQDAPRDQGART